MLNSNPALFSFTGSSAPQGNIHLSEAEPDEAGPSHGTYIIPIADVTIESSSGTVLDAVRYEYRSDTKSFIGLTGGEKQLCI